MPSPLHPIAPSLAFCKESQWSSLSAEIEATHFSDPVTMSLLMNCGRAVYLAKEGLLWGTLEVLRLAWWVVCLPWVATL